MIPDSLKKKQNSILKSQSPAMIIHTSQLISDPKMTTQIKVNFRIMFMPLMQI